MNTRPPGLAWIRYGDPIPPHQLRAAAGKFRAVVLQPWEEDAAAFLKAADPSCTVLAYQCLSSVRTYEPGPRYSSGISPARARTLGSFAGVPEWRGYPGHQQQTVWDPQYQAAWVESVVEWVQDSPFDGVMADNDVFEDYYGTGLPAQLLRDGLNTLVIAAGEALRQVGKVLVPNIAESRREAGRWATHSQFGGGLEEVWLGWGTGTDERLALHKDVAAQAETLLAPGLTIARTAGADNLGLAVAAAWVFAPGADVAVTATDHDAYSGLPWMAVPDFGVPVGDVQRTPGVWAGAYWREFSGGRVALNLGAEPVRVYGRELGFCEYSWEFSR